MRTTSIGRQAVVVGAGIGGLTAARALADRFEHVIVLERDLLPSDTIYRAGTPQARHAHTLLLGGQRALNELFPGFEQDLVRAGAPPFRIGLDVRWEVPGYDPFPQRDLGWTSYSMSRPLIELAVRQRVERFPNIVLRQRCRARQFVATPDGAAVVAVRCEYDDGRSETLQADLFLDASGRGALTRDLLASTGRPPPQETTINVDIGYSTLIFAIPDDAAPGWKGVYTMPQVPESGRGALILPIEGKRWMVTLAGRYGDKPPTDGDAFLAYAQGLRTATVYSALKHARRQGDVARFGFPASVLRRFEAQSLPRGLIPFSDGICRFNPVYGQGMSVAAQQACLLHRLLGTLAEEPDGLARLASTFLAEVQRVIETPWALTEVADLAYPQSQGHRPPYLETALRFQVGLLRLAADDPAVHKLMIEVQNLLKPRSVYSDPTLARRVKEVMPKA